MVTGCLDDLRYVLMRGARLVCVLAAEVVMVAGAAVAFSCAAIGAMDLVSPPKIGERAANLATQGHTGWYDVLMANHPGACAVPAAALCLLGLCAAVSWGGYRYNTSKPGLDVRECGTCRVRIPNEWFCGACKSFRPAKAFSLLLWSASLAVTAVYVVHDVLSFGLFALGRR